MKNLYNKGFSLLLRYKVSKLLPAKIHTQHGF